MPTDILRDAFLTGSLTEEQRGQLVAAGELIAFATGELLFTEGRPAEHLWILLQGSIELTRRSAAQTVVLGTMSTPGQWAGGLRAWGRDDATAGYQATGHGAEPGRCLRVPSTELGRLVGEWFPFGRHMIVGIYQTVRGIEAMARQRESLVALGTLAAGLAHEINNPAAASLRAVDGLHHACDAMLGSLTDLAGCSITAGQYSGLEARRVEARGAEPPDPGALAAADREEEIGGWLSDHDVPDGWRLAPTFASAGVDREWCERVGGTVGADALGPAFRWLASTLDAGTLLEEMRDTTTRISNLVEAVKSYSQMDRAPRRTVDVHDGLESTLTMLAPKLHDVDVDRAYGSDLPPIEVFAGELNQVWTNLIDNAVDAMDGHGSLSITTRADGDDLVVELADTGCGMPAAVEARAFEPFFTTKDVGRGTGLGLDISRRIVVERHGGDITFDSGPGGTTVHVRLPISGATDRGSLPAAPGRRAHGYGSGV